MLMKKEQLREYEKKRKKAICDNLSDDEKEQVRKDDKKRKMNKRSQTLDERNSIFNNLQMCSMVDPFMLSSQAFRLTEGDFEIAFQEGPAYIYICWKFEFWQNVIKFKELKYQTDIYNERVTGKSDWVCKSCHNSMSKKKMPMQTQVNNMELSPKFSELNKLCPSQLMLVSKIIPFMFLVAKTKGAQHGLKGQCVLVPTELK